MNAKPGAIDVRPRMLMLARRLYEGVTVTTRFVMTEFGVCERTARKDLELLRLYLPCEQFQISKSKAVRLARGRRRFER